MKSETREEQSFKKNQSLKKNQNLNIKFTCEPIHFIKYIY